MRRIAIVVVLVLAAHAARAEPEEVPEAQRLFLAARALVDQGKQAEACAMFQQSYDLERAAGTMLNLAECAERDGKLRRAWLLFDAAAQEYDRTHKAGPARFARERAGLLAPRLATLVIKLAEPRLAGLTVRIGDHAAPPAPSITERVDPGAIAIAVSAPGREPFRTTATADSAREVVVEIPALHATAVAPPVTRADEPGPRKRSRLYLAAGLGGAGVLALAASAIAGLRARSAYDAPFDDGRCTKAEPRPLCSEAGASALDDAGTTADIATGLGVAGAVLVAAGAVVYLTAPRETRIAPTAGPGALGMAITGRF